MNSSSITIWYESGCAEEIHIPDPAFENGVVLQREFVDFGDPDSGIFLSRGYISDQDDPDAERADFRDLREKTMVVSPDDLAHALLVTWKGVEVLRRSPLAQSECGLEVCMQREIGFSLGAVEQSSEWLAGGLKVVLSRLSEVGPDGVSAAETTFNSWREVLDAPTERQTEGE